VESIKLYETDNTSTYEF